MIARITIVEIIGHINQKTKYSKNIGH